MKEEKIIFEAINRGMKLFDDKLKQGYSTIGEIGTYYYFMMVLYNDLRSTMKTKHNP